MADSVDVGTGAAVVSVDVGKRGSTWAVVDDVGKRGGPVNVGQWRW